MVEGGGFARGTAAAGDLADRHRADRVAPSADGPRRHGRHRPAARRGLMPVANAAERPRPSDPPQPSSPRASPGDRAGKAAKRSGRRRPERHPAGTAAEVFWTFLRLGLTSFGGPVAHLGYFRAECVERRKWLDEHSYADIVALCQFLPGPASSQVGHGPRHPARRPAGCAGRLGRVYDAVGAGDDPVRLRGERTRRPVRRRLAARAEDRRGRGRRAGGLGHGAQPRPRPRARHDRGRRPPFSRWRFRPRSDRSARSLRAA